MIQNQTLFTLFELLQLIAFRFRLLSDSRHNNFDNSGILFLALIRRPSAYAVWTPWHPQISLREPFDAWITGSSIPVDNKRLNMNSG